METDRNSHTQLPWVKEMKVFPSTELQLAVMLSRLSVIPDGLRCPGKKYLGI